MGVRSIFEAAGLGYLPERVPLFLVAHYTAHHSLKLLFTRAVSFSHTFKAQVGKFLFFLPMHVLLSIIKLPAFDCGGGGKSPRHVRGNSTPYGAHLEMLT